MDDIKRRREANKPDEVFVRPQYKRIDVGKQQTDNKVKTVNSWKCYLS